MTCAIRIQSAIFSFSIFSYDLQLRSSDHFRFSEADLGGLDDHRDCGQHGDHKRGNGDCGTGVAEHTGLRIVVHLAGSNHVILTVARLLI